MTNDIAASFTWFHHNMPYYIKPIFNASGEHLYLPLNRDYNPLGTGQMEAFENFDEHLGGCIVFDCDPLTIEGLFYEGYHLYDDTAESMEGYYNRLAIMFKSCPQIDDIGTDYEVFFPVM